MAYYDALKAKWAQAPAGTTDQKLTWVNAQVVTGPAIRMVVPVYEIYNRIDRTEYSGLTAQNEQAVQRNLNVPTVDYSPGSGLRTLFATLFPVGTASPSTSKTQNNLAPYVAQFDTPQIPWATAPVANGGGGYPAPITGQDLVNAGLS